MLRRLNELKKHEEGQALVLAAICMLILTLCVLATVNLSYAATEKVRLQNAADSAAYSTAAYQARSLNFMAYTNRTMAVHYASQMTFHALVTYVGFVAITFTSLSVIPIVGGFFGAIGTVLAAAARGLDIFVGVLTILTDGINLIMWTAQQAVSLGTTTRALSGVSAEVKRYNPNYEVDPGADILTRLGGALGWQNAVDAGMFWELVFPSTSQNATAHRAYMVEVANSARHAWTAHGGKRNCQIGGLVIPRRCNFDWTFIFGGKTARTEWGAFSSSGGGLFGFLDKTEQIYSVDQFLIGIRPFPPYRRYRIEFSLDVAMWADREGGGHHAKYDIDFCVGLPRLIRRLCNSMTRSLARTFSRAVTQFVDRTGLNEGFHFHGHFGQMPFARYNPNRGFSNRLDVDSQFNQPPTLVVVRLPREELLRRGQPFMGKFGARIGTLTGANTNLDDRWGAGVRTPPKRGWNSQVDFAAGVDRPLPFTQEGFVAMSAAMAYYHRPGDWREPPNLFNPFWGAKLMPIVEYPTIASNPMLRTLFNDRYIVH